MSPGPGSPHAAPDESSSVVVYRTRLVYELDVVADALSRAGIPHFRRGESIGGLSFAMPVMPTMAPSTIWAIVVPESWADRARHFIASLPVSQDAEPKSLGTPSSVRPSSRSWAWLFVLGMALLLGWTVIRLLARLLAR
jgi:hypothetical protein